MHSVKTFQNLIGEGEGQSSAFRTLNNGPIKPKANLSQHNLPLDVNIDASTLVESFQFYQAYTIANQYAAYPNDFVRAAIALHSLSEPP